MDYRTNKEEDDGSGSCQCKAPDPPKDESGKPAYPEQIRRLLEHLKPELDNDKYRYKPNDATKKFADDLKEGDTEYQGIATIVSKYKEFYEKLKCNPPLVKQWKDQIEAWGNDVDEDTRKDIDDLWRNVYKGKQKELYRKWIEQREKLSQTLDCLEQARWRERDKKENFDNYKNFEKDLSARLKDLEGLFKTAEEYRRAGRNQAVYAVLHEFNYVYRRLNRVLTWPDTENEGQGQTAGDQQKQSDQKQSSHEEPRLYLRPPEIYKEQLTKALRELIIARYQRFRWHQQRLELEADTKRFKEEFEKFKETRRKQFIQEAEDTKAKAQSTPA